VAGPTGSQGIQGPTGPSGLLTATSPIVYNNTTKNVSLSQSELEDILDFVYIRIDGTIDGGTI
jgi:hypothetical protein